MNKDMNKSSIEAAQEAIAKVNAMLIAKGKLKPSQLSNTGIKKPGIQSNIITRDVEINDVPIGCRNMLTRGATQEEISKLSGAAVATKGRYMTQEDKLRNPKDRPLYLYVQGTSPDAVNLAVGRINEIIANGMAKQGPRMSRFSARGSNHHTGHRQPVPLLPPNNPHENPVPMTLLQEKLYIGLEHAPPNFSVKDKIFGPGGAFLQHIQAETGAKVSLRGKGSGFIEPTGGELMEPMHVHLQHVNMNGLQQAKELATNLIQTVQQEYAAFQQSFVSVPPPNMGIQHQSMMVPPPQIVSLAQPPPLLPGQQIITSMPPPQQIIQQPQSTYLGPPPPATMTVSLPAPGVVIPQLATSMAPVMQTQPQPGQLIQQSPPMQTYVQHSIGQPGQPVQQYIQSSEQQIIGGQFVSQPQVVVSLSPGQQPGQVVYSTIGGQPLQHPVQLQQPPPQQLMTAQGVQIQQPQIYQQPGQILQQPPPQQQLQQQFAYQQQQQQQQHQLIQQGQQTIISGAPRYIQQPIGQTSIQQLVPSATVQLATALPPAPMGQQPAPQPVQPVSWGGPAQSVPGSVYSTMQQYSQSGDSIMSVSQSQPGLVMSSSTSSTTTPSGYVYKTGPVEEPKRRFTEEKQEDKVPEGLLGYEHGPPHLTNLMVQPGQPQQPQPPTSQQQQLTQVSQDTTQQQPQQQQQLMYGQQILQPQPTELQQPLPQPQQLLYSQVVQQQPGLQQQQPQQQYTIVSQQQQPQYYQQQQQQQMYQQQQQQYQQQQNQQLQQNQLQQQQTQQLQQQYNQQYQQQQMPQIQEQARVEGDAQSQGQTTVPGEPKGEDKLLMPPPPPPGELIPGVTTLKRQSPGLTPQSAPEPRKKRFHDDDDDADIPSSMASQAKELKKFSFNQYSSTPQLYTNQTTTTYSQYGAAQNGSPSPGQDQYQPDGTYQQQQYQQDPQNTSHYGITSTGQTYSQYSVPTSSSYSPPASSTQHQPPPPPPPLYEDQSSRSPESRSKGFNPQYISTFSREENSVLRQPPPPPPPPGGRSRTYW